MLGFALSPDGTHIAAGGPDGGVYVASTSDYQFKKTAAPVKNLRCLTWGSAGIYACSKEATDGWTVALSTDDGQSFAPLLHMGDITPLSCAAATSVGTTCSTVWPSVQRQLASTLDAGTDASPLYASSPLDASSPAVSQSSDDGGSADASAFDDASASDGGPPTNATTSGCSCRISTGEDSPSPALLCIGLGVTACLGRRFGCKRSRRKASRHS